MGNSDDNGYSTAFVDGVIRDLNERKNRINNNQRVFKIPAANPDAAPADDNQGAAGQDVIDDGNADSSAANTNRQKPAYIPSIIGNCQNVMPVKEYINVSRIEDSGDGLLRNRDTAPGTTAPAGNKAMSYDEMSGMNKEDPVTLNARRFNLGSPADNTQRVADQSVILDRNSVGKQRILQINPNQNTGNGSVNRINPYGLKTYCDAKLLASPIRDAALTCFGEASNGCASGANEKRAITDSIYNRVRTNKSYWGGNTVIGVLSKPGQYEGYGNSQYEKAKKPEVLNEKECQKLKDCISAAQASADGTQNNFTNFKQKDRAGRVPICNHYFWKE